MTIFIYLFIYFFFFFFIHDPFFPFVPCPQILSWELQRIADDNKKIIKVLNIILNVGFL